MRNANEKVVAAYLRPGTVHGDFMECMLNLVQYDTVNQQRLTGTGGRLSYRAGHNLSGPRNEVVRKFLDYGQADWLWFVDSDMTFSPDVVDRLLEYADPEEAPIVGGLCFGFDENGGIAPTLYGLAGDGADPSTVTVTRYQEWPPDTMYQVAATGAACLLIHKTVLERMRDFDDPRRPGKVGFNDAFPWFQETEHNGQGVSEDFTFCWRAGLLKIPIYVNTAVQLGHIKDRLLTMDTYFLSRGLLAPTHSGAAV